MPGLYLDTLIIGPKLCNMLSILNEITMQKELQNHVTKMLIHKNNKTIKHKKSLPEPEIEPGTSRT